jgi:hypothetical protein
VAPVAAMPSPAARRAVPTSSVTPLALPWGPSASQSHTVITRSAPEPFGRVHIDRAIAAGLVDVGAHLVLFSLVPAKRERFTAA